MAKEEISFESVLRNPVYKDRDMIYALNPPTGLLHRTDQKNELVMELAPILMNSAVSCIFVYGNPGTGKTSLVNELSEKLSQEATKNKVKLEKVYVNCSENRSETTILIDLLSQLNPDKEYPRLGWNRSKAIEEFTKELDKRSSNLLVILDEVDYVLKESGDDILYRLSRVNEQNLKSKVSTIIISNDIRVSDYIKPRTQSAFGRVKVIFPPYGADDLEDILKDRVELALKHGVCSEAVIKKIAEIEASRGGDARRALELLDSCAKISMAKGLSKISLEVVNEADSNLENNGVFNTIASLTKHQKILYLTMIKNQKKVMVGGDVYKEYLEMCKQYNIEPLTERMIRSFFINFTEVGLIKSEVGWLQSAKKKIRKITFNLDKALMKKAEKLLRDTI
ncbi:MAG TPA: AAA family ATPase [Candidatus Nanoarchaeia archaeon]|nr:AAA family ATPase [Candidatus Nanoarchaeia archaeon]